MYFGQVRIGFYLTEGSKPSGAFLSAGTCFCASSRLSANPQNISQNFLSTLYLSLFFFRQVSSLHFEIASFMQNVMTLFAF